MILFLVFFSFNRANFLERFSIDEVAYFPFISSLAGELVGVVIGAGVDSPASEKSTDGNRDLGANRRFLINDGHFLVLWDCSDDSAFRESKMVYR